MSERSKTGGFFRALEQLGVAIGSRRWTGSTAAFGPDEEDLDIEGTCDLIETSRRSRPARPSTAAPKASPISAIVLGPGGVRHVHGSEPAPAAHAVPEAEDAGKEKAPRDSAAQLRRRIQKLQRDIARMEARSAEKAGQNETE